MRVRRPTSIVAGSLALLLAALLGLGPGASDAAAAPTEPEESFDLWRFPVPKGWATRRQAGVFALAFAANGSTGQIGVYKSRPRDAVDLAAELEREWKEVVEGNHVVGGTAALPDRRLASGPVAQGRGAATTNKAGEPSATVLFVVVAYGRVVSIVVQAPTMDALIAHDKTVAVFLDSLRLDPEAVAREIGAQPGDVTGASAVVGAWGASRGGGTGAGGVLTGS